MKHFFTFAGGNHNSMGAVWLALGSTFISLGALYSRKAKEAGDDQEEKANQ